VCVPWEANCLHSVAQLLPPAAAAACCCHLLLLLLLPPAAAAAAARLLWYKEPTPEAVGDLASHLLGRVEV
jgi:hypothetical protein